MTRRACFAPAGRSLLFAAWILCAALPAWGQVTREHDLPELDRQLNFFDVGKVRLNLSNRFIAAADFGNFEATSYQPEAQLLVSTPINGSSAIRVIGRGRVLIYDFTNRVDLEPTPQEDPFDNLNSWSLRLQAATQLGESFTVFSDRERWSTFAEVATGSSWEANADMGDAVRWGGSLGIGYTLGRDFSLALGISLGNKWDGGVRVSPLFELDWRINDRWSIHTTGLGLQIDRIIMHRVRLYARARLEGGGYLLANRGAEVGDGRLRLRQVPVSVGVRWDVSSHLRLNLGVGVMAYNQLRLEDEDGDKVGERTASPSAYILLRLDLRS